MLAAEKAQRLAREGYRTLLVCFNQPLARFLADSLEPDELLDVSTFHELCLDLGREAHTLLDPEPVEKDSDWFSVTLPRALEQAIGLLGPRYHALVVDEGQDFERSWLESLQLLLPDPANACCTCSTTPPSRCSARTLSRHSACRSTRSTGTAATRAQSMTSRVRHAPGLGAVEVMREEGRRPVLIEAAPGRDALEQLRKVLHRLVAVDGVAPWRIAVLTGRSAAKSDAWRQRRFGDQVLWNCAHDDAGISRGPAAADLPEQPSDTILFDTIRRFKGLEREVVVLVELDPADQRLDQLLYVGATRARQHLVVIAPPGVA
jgi:hypothetical protein